MGHDEFDDLRDRMIFDVVAALTSRGGSAGNTHIQKAMYLVQAICRTSSFRYRVYHYGPFSKELESRVATLVDRGRLERVPGTRDAPDRYRIRQGSVVGTVRDRDPAVDFVARTVARWPTRRLEGVTTTLWLRQEFPIETEAEITSRLQRIKPHISRAEARDAAAWLERLMAGAARAGLRPNVAADPRLSALQREVMRLKAERARASSLREEAEISVLIEEAMGGRPPTRGVDPAD